MVLPAELRRNVSREEINELPIRRYEGEVCVVAGAAELERAMADLHQERLAGFDTETRPAFRVGESHPPALAQVATARAVYLFPLRSHHYCPPVAELLASASTIKAGVGLAEDLRQLKKVFAFAEKSIVDLGDVAKRHGLKQTGVRNLTGLLLGFRIPKGTKTSNWARQRLTPQQITYAATDAWACRELYLRFRNRGLV